MQSMGGFRVELMNERDEVITTLTPNDGSEWTGAYDQT